MPSGLPPSSRIWVFAAPIALASAARTSLERDVNGFIGGWTSHGRPVPAEVEFLEDRFLTVAAYLGDQPNAGVSGCGIDAMTRAVEGAASRAGFSWLDGLSVVYRDEAGQIQACSRTTFRRLAREGVVNTTTPVFDLTVTDLGTLRERGLERPAGTAWHARAFPLAKPA